MTFTVRAAVATDATEMAGLLNEIIAIGGTTAHQAQKSVARVLDDYITGPDVVAAVVAVNQDQVIGWQSVGLWQGDAHIGTFVRQGLQARGVGAALFGLTSTLVRKAGTKSIHASIRADNTPGLANYARLGFVDYALEPDWALADGRKVGRVSRRFDL